MDKFRGLRVNFFISLCSSTNQIMWEVIFVSCVSGLFSLQRQEAGKQRLTILRLVSSLNWTKSLTGDERQRQQC